MEFGSTQDWFELNAQVAFGNNKVKFKGHQKCPGQRPELCRIVGWHYRDITGRVGPQV